MREEQIFHDALQQPSERRCAFVEAACGGDLDLQRRVELLLRAHEDPGSFLQLPAVADRVEQDRVRELIHRVIQDD